MDNVVMKKARAALYEFLSASLIYKGLESHKDLSLLVLENLKANPFDPVLASGVTVLHDALANEGSEPFTLEFDAIFNDPMHKIEGASASYYDEGHDRGKKLMEARSILAETKVRRDESVFVETEDHFGFLFALMQRLIVEKVDDPNPYCALEKQLFEWLLNAYVEPFAEAIRSHEKAVLYGYIAQIMQSFIRLERLWFDIDAPVRTELEKEEEARRRGGRRRPKEDDGAWRPEENEVEEL